MKIIKLLSQQCWQWWPCSVFRNQTFLTTAWRELVAAKLSSSQSMRDVKVWTKMTLFRFHESDSGEQLSLGGTCRWRRRYTLLFQTQRETILFVCVCKLFETTGLVCLYGILLLLFQTQRERPLCTSGLSDNSSIDLDIDLCANFSAPYTNLWGSIC